MKPVIYNLNSIRPPITGIGRYAIELLRGGLQAGLSVSAVHGGELHREQALTKLLNRFDSSSVAGTSNWRKILGRVPLSRDLYRQFDKWKISRLLRNDTRPGVLFHDINYSSSPVAGSNISTVYDLSHHHYPDTHPEHRVRFLNRYLGRLAAADRQIITISNSVKQELMQRHKLAAERIHVTHLAADPVFHPRSQTECEPVLRQYNLGYKQYILSVGTLEPRKNLNRVLDAYLALDQSLRSAFPLVLAGPTGWRSASLENKITQLQKTGQVIRIGFVPQSQLPLLYASAAIFVYPSLYEGFGLPLLEAMQSGSPTITSNSGALAEVAGEHALQIDPLNCDEMGAKISALLESRDLHSHYSTSGRERASHFSWSKTVKQTHQLYNRLDSF